MRSVQGEQTLREIIAPSYCTCSPQKYILLLSHSAIQYLRLILFWVNHFAATYHLQYYVGG